MNFLEGVTEICECHRLLRCILTFVWRFSRAVLGDAFGAFLVRVVLAVLALHALPEQTWNAQGRRGSSEDPSRRRWNRRREEDEVGLTFEEFLAVFTDGWCGVGVKHEGVWHLDSTREFLLDPRGSTHGPAERGSTRLGVGTRRGRRLRVERK